MASENCRTHDRPAIVCAADDKYAICMAAMTASLIANNKNSNGLRLFVLDGGISESHRSKLFEGWPEDQVHVTWLKPDFDQISNLPVSEHVSRMTYARIMLPELLPRELSRVIYLDCDLVAQGDISSLWKEPFDGHLLMAVQDVSAPYIDSEIYLPNYRQLRRRLAATRPVPNYRALGLTPESPYFNGGVLCIDLSAWRDQGVSQELLKCLEANKDDLLWWDQYALNVVLHDKWKALDTRWNQLPKIFEFSDWQRSPFSERQFEQARSSPFIFHFATAVKPWQFGYWGPNKQLFFTYLDHSAWRGWRPHANCQDASHCSYEFLKSLRRAYL